jgi:hypothetical protein
MQNLHTRDLQAFIAEAVGQAPGSGRTWNSKAQWMMQYAADGKCSDLEKKLATAVAFASGSSASAPPAVAAAVSKPPPSAEVPAVPSSEPDPVEVFKGFARVQGAGKFIGRDFLFSAYHSPEIAVAAAREWAKIGAEYKVVRSYVSCYVRNLCIVSYVRT